MASKVRVKLRDGADATVSIEVSVDAGDTSGDLDGRERDLENLLAGALAGAAPDVIGCQLAGWDPSVPRRDRAGIK